MRNDLNNLSMVFTQVKMNSLSRSLGLIAICCAFAVSGAQIPKVMAAQILFPGPDVPALNSPKNSNLIQVTMPKATLQGELVPIRETKSTEFPEYQFLPQANTEINGPASTQAQSVLTSEPATGSANRTGFSSVFPPTRSRTEELIPLQRQSQGFAPDGDPNLQTSVPAYRPQSSRRIRDSQAIESLPLPLDEEEEGENVIIQRYPNGKPQIIRHVDQDEQGNYYNHGPWEVRNQAGQIVAEGTYDRGLMDGQWSRKHEAKSSGLFATKPFSLFQGPFHSVAQFKNGKLDGLWTIYDQYQTKIFEIEYSSGVRHGTATWFYPNQGKMREATFKEGLIDGEILDFDDAEKVAKRQQYVDGRPIVRNTTFYRPNVKKTEDYYLGKKLAPEGSDDWWEAKPTPYVATGTETQNGAAMSWYENGQRKKRGQFKDGNPVGEFVLWHANGNKQTEGFFVEGQKNRRWTWWHENGMKQFEGEYKDDRPIGIWRAWQADGELRKEKNYSPTTESDANNRRSQSGTTEAPNRAEQDAQIENQRVITQKPAEPIVDPTAEPSVNGPTSEVLPTPVNKSPPQKKSEEMETISPLEFRTPTTPSDKPQEKAADAEEEDDDIGLIPAELFESQSDPPAADSAPTQPETNDKSA